MREASLGASPPGNQDLPPPVPSSHQNQGTFGAGAGDPVVRDKPPRAELPPNLGLAVVLCVLKREDFSPVTAYFLGTGTVLLSTIQLHGR